jgi:amino acid transporter
MSESTSEPTIKPRLGLWDAVSIIVGIVVGTAIFRSPSMVFSGAGGPWMAIGLWTLGGALAWCGAVCYAELATTYPRDGGDYEYLHRAYGSWAGFLFSWAQLTTVISGNIAIMAYAFADYGVRLWPGAREHAILLTVTPVIVLSAMNMLGIVAGKWTQNVLTVAKVVGLTGLVLAGIFTTGPYALDPSQPAGPSTSPAVRDIGLALVFVLYAYGGWSHAAYVAAEVRDRDRNLPRALVLGITGITVIYLVVITSYLHALGFDGARQSRTPAAEVLELAIGPWGGRPIGVLVMLSALGAINGMILTGSRIYAVWGADYPALHWLAGWNRRLAAPLAAIAAQGLIAVVLVVLVGTETGKNYFDATLNAVGLDGLPWDKFDAGFETLVAGSAPVYWLLCLATGSGLFVLRAKNPTITRPFQVPLYPVPVILFCLTCTYMLWSSLEFAGWLSLIGFAPLVVGAVLWAVVRPRGRKNSS